MQEKLIKEKLAFQLNLKNNTGSSQPIILFDVAGAYDAGNGIVGSNDFTYDMTTAVANAIFYGFKTVAVLAAPAASGIYQLYTAVNSTNIAFANIAEIVDTLNSLNLGTFSIVSGNTIVVQSSTMLFSSINTTQLYNTFHDDNTYGTDFTISGSLIFNAGYTAALAGTFSQITLANAFWKNTMGQFLGPFNRSNIFANKSADNESGFFANVNATVAKTVYMGFAASVYAAGNFIGFCKIFLNGTQIIDLTDPGALTTLAGNINTALGTAYSAADVTFPVWFIVPIELLAGNNIIQMTNEAQSGQTQILMGMEIYDNTAAEIILATSYAGLNLLFSSIDYEGKQFF